METKTAIENIAANSDKIVADLQKVIAKAQALAPDVWDNLVSQKMMEGKMLIINTLIPSIIWVIVLIVSILVCKKCWFKNAESDGTEAEIYGVCGVISGIIAAVSFFGVVISITTSIDDYTLAYMMITNPQYYAACDIVKLFL
jgi:F0F1-type ATP synthase membrane subunit c/vacuolar-type H+-ATPase subunit K